MEEEDENESEEQSREQQLQEAQESVEEQALMWNNRKYEEQREGDKRKWRNGKDQKVSRVRKEHLDSKEQNRRKKRRKYSLIEEHWGEDEQKQVEEGANTEQLRPTEEQPEEQPTHLYVEQSPTNAAPLPPNPPSKGEQDIGYKLRGAGHQARLTDYFVRAQTHDQPTSVVAGHVDNHDNNKLSTAPSVNMNVKSEVCKPDNRGWCMKHNCEMRKI